MSGAILPLSQYAFIAWCLVKAQGQLYLLPLLCVVKPVKDAFKLFSAVLACLIRHSVHITGTNLISLMQRINCFLLVCW